jgi:hypothetical protein
VPHGSLITKHEKKLKMITLKPVFCAPAWLQKRKRPSVGGNDDHYLVSVATHTRKDLKRIQTRQEIKKEPAALYGC